MKPVKNAFLVLFALILGCSKQNDPQPTPTPTPTPQQPVVNVPSAPKVDSVLPSNGAATVPIVASTDNGGATITGYTITAWIGTTASKTLDVSTAGTVNFTGLTNGTTYTFSAVAKNSAGSSAKSNTSNEVIPRSPAMEKINISGKAWYLINADYFKDNTWKPYILSHCDSTTQYYFDLNLKFREVNPSCVVFQPDKYTITDDAKTLVWTGKTCTILTLDQTTLQYTYIDGTGMPQRETYKTQ